MRDQRRTRLQRTTTLRKGFLGAAIIAGLTGGSAGPGWAGFIQVNTTANVSGDGKCGLREAVAAANTNTAQDACPAGDSTSDDLIALGAGTYDLGTSSLAITSALRIIGFGFRNTKITTSGLGNPPAGMTLAACGGRRAGLYVAGNGLSMSLEGLTLEQTAGADTQGICFVDGTLTLYRVRVTGFRVRGIWATSALGRTPSLTLDHAWLDNNHAYNDGFGGAGLYYKSSQPLGLTVRNTSITNNKSDDKGGGLYVGGAGVGGFPTVDNATISGNTAALDGGGIYQDMTAGGEQYLKLNFVTITKNTATGIGGGIFKTPNTGADLKIFNSVVHSNTATANSELANLNRVAGTNNHTQCSESIVYLQGGWTTTTRPQDVSNAPGSCDYATSTSPVSTSLSGRGGFDNLPVHTLTAGSVALDRIQSNSDTVLDQRDMERPIDGDSNGSAKFDAGAFEARPILLETDTLTVASVSAGVTHTTISDGGATGGTSRILRATAVGHQVTYQTNALSPNTTYAVTVRHKRGSDLGDFKVCMPATATGSCSTTLVDMSAYNPQGTDWYTWSGGTVTTSSASGTRYIRFEVTGKDSGSSGYNVAPDFIDFKKQ